MSLLKEYVESAAAPLEQARSLPFGVYTDASVLAEERRRIFAGDWVFVCMDRELREPGDYFAMTLAGEPIIVLRDREGQLRALSNVCRHRGTPLLDDGFGTVDRFITCPYHAWTYDFDGSLKAIPHNRTIAVEREDHSLSRFRVDTWNGLVFVNLSTLGPTLAERLHGLNDYLAPFAPATFEHASWGEPEIWKANWKLAIENAVESYHLFMVHANTLETVSPTKNAYYMAGYNEWAVTGGATERSRSLLGSLFGSDSPEIHNHYLLVSIPPSFVGVLTVGSFGWLSAHPLDAETTLIRSGSTLARDPGGKGGIDPFTKAFFEEDQAICERVQSGMRAQLSSGGKLVDMERVVVDFHQYLASRLGGHPTVAFHENPEAVALLGQA